MDSEKDVLQVKIRLAPNIQKRGYFIVLKLTRSSSRLLVFCTTTKLKNKFTQLVGAFCVICPCISHNNNFFLNEAYQMNRVNPLSYICNWIFCACRKSFEISSRSENALGVYNIGGDTFALLANGQLRSLKASVNTFVKRRTKLIIFHKLQFFSWHTRWTHAGV